MNGKSPNLDPAFRPVPKYCFSIVKKWVGISCAEQVYRHGNHNYFKATFMFYHTDIYDRILGRQQNHSSFVVLLFVYTSRRVLQYSYVCCAAPHRYRYTMFYCGFLLWSGSPDLEWQNAIRIHRNTGGPLTFYCNWFTSLAFVSQCK